MLLFQSQSATEAQRCPVCKSRVYHSIKHFRLKSFGSVKEVVRGRLENGRPVHEMEATVQTPHPRAGKLVLEADNIYLLRAHETELLKRYPDQVLNMYAREINRAARSTADRSTYQQWVLTLQHMREMPGGEKVVEEIVAAWRVQYKRRSAMMDELNAL